MVILVLFLIVGVFSYYFYRLINKPVEIKIAIEEPPSISCQCYGTDIGMPIYPEDCAIQPSVEPVCDCPSIGEGKALVSKDFCLSDERLAGQ